MRNSDAIKRRSIELYSIFSNKSSSSFAIYVQVYWLMQYGIILSLFLNPLDSPFYRSIWTNGFILLYFIRDYLLWVSHEASSRLTS